MDQPNQHDARILDQFTKQANPFADQPAHSQESSLLQIIETADVRADHSVLDVACGPALLTTALARVAKRVVGCDLTPAMLERAALERDKAGLDNLTFDLSDARALPYADDSFDRVLTRFSFHHFEHPADVLRELVRVCKPGGLVSVIDVTPERDKRAAYDQAELLRDPSHARACTLEELMDLFHQQGLEQARVVRYQLAMPFETQLAASFPHPGDGERLRALLQADARDGGGRLSMSAHHQDDELWLAYPCAIVVGQNA